ncbi:MULTISPECIES: hypothetical protein [Jonquetella]|uniref:Uncharacterized protein n=1 Tax=Jonquetella anthropi DSM 22815 TaxID=885272 RepID=H0UJG1_9BACT|nr:MULTISPECIES: hypothetical protein [Jonquetella]EEX49153.1 hypothetical protein GCWU000246_00239 [Jonquetella anthropi E3_33 E1]EHM13928.1 hypothetical protein JonanDRAFT_1569 [Jonquetella anthropi DSM 22815]ERL24149.1 hypothetical protein HMPREF1249_0873 [Jonquetella sp. BV3C21]
MKLVDLTVFSRVISIAFTVAGTMGAALLIGRELVSRGYPSWALGLSLVVGTFAALGLGFREIRRLIFELGKRSPGGKEDTKKWKR